MAFVWLAATTQQGQSMVSGALKDAGNSLLEVRLSGHLSVERVTGRVVVLVAIGSAAKSIAEKQIADTKRLQCGLQRLAVEVWRDARVGVGTEVDDELDFFPAKKGAEPLKVVVRVPDGPQGWRRRHARPCYAGAPTSATATRRETIRSCGIDITRAGLDHAPREHGQPR